MPTKKGQSKEPAAASSRGSKKAAVSNSGEASPPVEKPPVAGRARVSKVKVVHEAAAAASEGKKAAPVKKASAKKASGPVVQAPEFTPQAIAVRAYFLSEKRRLRGGAPDPTHDWLQAESELLAEIERFRSAAAKKKTKGD